jgi:hypothetical protein
LLATECTELAAIDIDGVELQRFQEPGYLDRDIVSLE